MTNLGQMLRKDRVGLSLSRRERAKQIGIPVSTYARVERTAAGLNAATFLTISAWLLSRAANGPRIRR